MLIALATVLSLEIKDTGFLECAPQVAPVSVTAFCQLYFGLFLASFSAVLNLCTSCTVYSVQLPSLNNVQLPSLKCVQCTVDFTELCTVYSQSADCGR